MTILKYAPGKLRPLQIDFLEWYEANYNKYDVVVCTAPTASGKSWMAMAVARFLAARSMPTMILTPTRLLSQQYAQEFTAIPMLQGRDNYTCIEKSDESCDKASECDKGHRKYCDDCPFYNARIAVRESDVAISNYHSYYYNRLYKGGLILDEAHNVTQFIMDLFSLELWTHIDKIPETLGSLGQFAIWLENRINAMVHSYGDDDDKMPEDIRAKLFKYRLCLSEIKHNNQNYHFEVRSKLYRGKMNKQILVRPLSARAVPQVLWPTKTVKKIVLFSATLSDVAIKDLGLANKRIGYYNCESPIPPERRPFLVMPKINMNYADRDMSVPQLAKLLDELSHNHPNTKGLVHLTYGMAEQIKPLLAHNPRFKFHDKTTKAKTYIKFKEEADNSILVGSGMSEGIDLKYESGRWQVICAIPYTNIGDPWVRAKMKAEPDWYDDQTVTAILQMTGRICRTPDDQGTTYMLDSRFSKFYFKNIKLFPDYFNQSLVWK